MGGTIHIDYLQILNTQQRVAFADAVRGIVQVKELRPLSVCFFRHIL